MKKIYSYLTLVFLLTLILLAMPMSQALALIIYDTGTNTIGSTGLYGGNAVYDDEYLGVKFEATHNYHAWSIGGHFGGTENTTIFAAIVKLDSVVDLPDSNDLSTADVIAYAVFAVPRASDVVWAPISGNIKKGQWYALIFGTGLFGANGIAYVPYENVTIESPAYIFSYKKSEDMWYDPYGSGSSNSPKAFGYIGLTTDRVARIPESSTLLLLSAGLAGLGILSRKLRRFGGNTVQKNA